MQAVLDVEDVLRTVDRDGRESTEGSPNPADTAAHRHLVSSAAAVGVRAISEEDAQPSEVGPLSADLRLYVDPIDGSRNWETGSGPFGPSVCLLDSGGPLWSAVYDLDAGRLVTAERGRGVTTRSTLPHHDVERRPPVVLGGPSWAPYEPGLRHAVNGATAHDLCALALGEYEIYLDTTNTVRPWDYLGGLLVLREAGGYCADLDGRVLVPDAEERFTRRLVALSPAMTRMVRTSSTGRTST
ncbi:inositol monophosphatase family protein [Saccharothrix sp. BKS2]|uniref:inositol monophosphatase family protein n=1 Tax=Saccharothrix sp. BKS2 TaxID=3064400 RepID=UPI0039EC10E7